MYKQIANRLFCDMKMKYLQMMHIDEHKILQGLQGTHVAEGTCTLQLPLVKDCSKLKRIIYSCSIG